MRRDAPSSCTWSSGASVLRSNRWGEKFFEKLSLDPAHVKMERLASGRAPLLSSHGESLDSVIGVVERAAIANGVGTCTVRFAKAEDDPFADQVFRKVKDGIITNVSVGYRVGAVQQLVESEAITTPTLLVTDWEPFEVSMVAMGEDIEGAVRAFDHEEASASWPQLTRSIPQNKEPHMDPVELKKQQDELAKREAAIKAREAELAEEKRKADITTLVTRSAKREGFNAELGAKLIKDGVSVEQARAAVIDEFVRLDEATAINNKHTATTGGETDDEKFSRGITGALLHRAEGGSLLRQAREAKVKGFEKIDESNEFRGLTLTDIARRCLERRGVKTEGLSRMELVGRAFTTRGAGYQGTADFPILLENTMGKVLLAAYETQPDTWSRFCKVMMVPDFRASPQYRTGSLAILDKKNEHGEFTNKNIPDGEKISISTETKGNIIAITREAIINDDMNALSGLGTALGRAARLSVEAEVYALLNANGGLGPTLSGNPFFHASRANVNATGAGLSAGGLDADAVVMSKQKDIGNNEFLDLQPQVLLVPRGLLSQAKILNASATNPDGGAGKSQVPNPVQGMFADIVGTSRLTDSTRRYLFANPQLVPAFVVAFLEEQGQAPVIETREGWRVDGSEMRVRFDFLAQIFDPKGAVTNAGA